MSVKIIWLLLFVKQLEIYIYIKHVELQAHVPTEFDLLYKIYESDMRVYINGSRISQSNLYAMIFIQVRVTECTNSVGRRQSNAKSYP